MRSALAFDQARFLPAAVRAKYCYPFLKTVTARTRREPLRSLGKHFAARFLRAGAYAGELSVSPGSPSSRRSRAQRRMNLSKVLAEVGLVRVFVAGGSFAAPHAASRAPARPRHRGARIHWSPCSRAQASASGGEASDQPGARSPTRGAAAALSRPARRVGVPRGRLVRELACPARRRTPVCAPPRRNRSSSLHTESIGVPPRGWKLARITQTSSVPGRELGESSGLESGSVLTLADARPGRVDLLVVPGLSPNARARRAPRPHSLLDRAGRGGSRTDGPAPRPPGPGLADCGDRAPRRTAISGRRGPTPTA